MHILFLTDNFPPETNAPASRTYEHAKRWVRAGHRVTVVTCAPNFPGGKVFEGYRNRLAQKEAIDGIEVLRVWSYITANEGFVKRTLDYASFMVSAVMASVFLPRPDVVVATSPQFFAAVAGYLVSRLRRRPFVFELRDLWPDSIVAVGAMGDSWVIRLLRRLEYFLYDRAARIVSVTHSFRSVLAGNGIPAEKIAVVPNGVDLESYQPGPRPEELARRLGVTGKFVAIYVGTLGMAHGLRVVLDAADRLKEQSHIAFVLVGAGAEREALEAEARRRGLGNVVFAGAVSKDAVKDYWRLGDVALVLLRDAPLFRHVIPSKMFEAMGMERAIILGVEGESRAILDRAGAGIAVRPENRDDLVAAVQRLAGDPTLRAGLARSGRVYVVEHFQRDRLAAEMLAELERSRTAG